MGKFLYFAYGSNMLTSRLRALTRCPTAEPLGMGTLSGRVLRFHKISRDESGKCDVAAGGSDDVVHGVVYGIATKERRLLDRAEGLGHGYNHEQISVNSDGGVRLCLTYVATDTRSGLRPYDWYKGLVMAGAFEQGLPDEYTAQIAAIPSVPDHDALWPERIEAERLLAESAHRHPAYMKRLIGAHDG